MNNVWIAMLSFVLAFSASLSAQGTPQTKWNRTFENPQASDTRPGGGNSVRGNKSVTTDAAGNVYVVGSTQTGGNQDILTAKYDAAGSAIWAASYGGPANADDFGYAIAVDSNGNVYAAGDSNNGSNLDFVLVKYDSNGNEQWVRTTNYGGTDTCYGVVVDSSDRVYIAGSGNSDAHIICYDTDGNVVWSDDYNNTTDLGYGLNVDASNNAYLVGRTVVAGNIDWFVAKYNASGVMQWDRTYNGTGNGFDEAYDVAVDATGNVLVAGVAADVNADAVVVKYDAAGTFQWAGYYNGSGNGAEACYAMGLDAAGNAYVATRAFGGATNLAAAVRFNATTGAVDWADEYASAGFGDDAYSISVNAAGDNVIGGFTGSATNGNDFLVVKHDAGGTQAWARTFDGSANSTDNAYGVAIDVSGNVIVAGQSATATTPEGIVRSYDSTGATNWTGTLVGSAGTSQVGSDFIPATRGAMVTDGSGNVYVTGRSFNGTDYDAVTVAYDSNGTVLWTATFDGGNGDDYAHGVAVNQNTGEVYV
ncbi:MAG: SBBP repeat-containing protein, partial [Planctomycetes bacterium]|nr:SBBP repeat-containing protein [Planctomycetota bacterium]